MKPEMHVGTTMQTMGNFSKGGKRGDANAGGAVRARRRRPATQAGPPVPRASSPHARQVGQDRNGTTVADFTGKAGEFDLPAELQAHRDTVQNAFGQLICLRSKTSTTYTPVEEPAE